MPRLAQRPNRETTMKTILATTALAVLGTAALAQETVRIGTEGA